jgi:hypothetical protein
MSLVDADHSDTIARSNRAWMAAFDAQDRADKLREAELDAAIERIRDETDSMTSSETNWWVSQPPGIDAETISSPRPAWLGRTAPNVAVVGIAALTIVALCIAVAITVKRWLA